MTKRPNPSRGINEALALSSPRVKHAFEVAHAALNAKKIPHVVIGGLAVAAHGYPRATRDVDFLVGDDAFERSTGGLVTFAPGVPYQVDGVAIDYLAPDTPEEHELLREAARVAPKPAIAPAYVIVGMKLRAGRAKDKADIVEMLKAGADVKEILDYIGERTPDQLGLFHQLTDAADDEAP